MSAQPKVCRTCEGAGYVLPALFPQRAHGAVWGATEASRQINQKPRRCPDCNLPQLTLALNASGMKGDRG